MDVEFLNEDINLLPPCSSISPETELIIRNSLVILQSENKFENIFFWGKIDGLRQDYLIAFGYNTSDNISQRRFFYSFYGIKWYLLPLPISKHYEACKEWDGRFTGDPYKVVIIKWNDKNVGIKEEDRLAYIVHLITEEAALVPRGALYMRVDGSIMRNPYFAGLRENSIVLSNYYFYRQPQNKNNNIQRKDYNEPIDFLDPIEPSNETTFCLSTSSPSNPNVILIRSLLWEGMNSFYEIRSGKFGFVYFGNGLKNTNLSSMV